MSKAIFLFDGGNYKRGVDSGRNRIPLTPQEGELVFYDPELPGDTDNSIGTTLNMQKYASLFCDLEVGDEIFIGVAPEAAKYHGLTMMSRDAIEGFTVDFDLVSIADVYAAGGETGVEGFSPALSYDFSNGLGEATKDAMQLVDLYGGEYSDYRNLAALVSEDFDPISADLGEAVYLRLTVTALGEFGSNAEDEGCCSSCGAPKFPTFQAMVAYDRKCIDRQQVRNFCNCPDSPCDEGCGDTSSGDDTEEDTTAPVVTAVPDQNDVQDVAITEVTLVADEDITTWTATPLPAGLSLDAATGVISGTPTAEETVIVVVTGTDEAGNTSEEVSFTWTVTAP